MNILLLSFVIQIISLLRLVLVSSRRDVHLQYAFIEPKHFKTKEMGNYFFINRTQIKKARRTQIRSLEKKQSLTLKPIQNTI